MSSPPENAESKADQQSLDLLFRYYNLLRQDLLTQASGVKNHFRNSQAIAGMYLAAISVLVNVKTYSVSNETLYLWLFGIWAITTIIYYLIYDIIESLFAVRALEQYLSFLEQRINSMIGFDRLTWQSTIAARLWSSSPRQIGFVPPMYGLTFYEIGLMFGATLAVPGYVYYLAWVVSGHNTLARLLLIALALYSVISAIAILRSFWNVNNRLRGKVIRMIDETGSSFPR
jgi:hypothetical protein